ncbi:MAG TPA: hypothetical protein DIU35_12860 [Candidatus Latescibacteria bacterium]|nr:hypothetical protein [Gemmatimonadota bacterium]HCR18364.1 hypothetical protein [Candidatus Latescibacterota bacterium]|tara:strand:+ start:364 stop:822 length:459 start_codon:yes stop_codon:yes gene_type:complete
MKTIKRTVTLLLVFGLILAFSAEGFAQRGRDGGGGRRGGGMLRMMLPVEATLSFLAFDDKIGLKDDQLLKIRKGLREIYGKRAGLVEEMQSGADREALMGKFRGLREKMLASVKGVLDENQNKFLDKYLKRMQEARQRRGGGRRGSRGGGTE